MKQFGETVLAETPVGTNEPENYQLFFYYKKNEAKFRNESLFERKKLFELNTHKNLY